MHRFCYLPQMVFVQLLLFVIMVSWKFILSFNIQCHLACILFLINNLNSWSRRFNSTVLCRLCCPWICNSVLGSQVLRLQACQSCLNLLYFGSNNSAFFNKSFFGLFLPHFYRIKTPCVFVHVEIYFLNFIILLHFVNYLFCSTTVISSKKSDCLY